jgi:hypothetical protein
VLQLATAAPVRDQDNTRVGRLDHTAEATCELGLDPAAQPDGLVWMEAGPIQDAIDVEEQDAHAATTAWGDG